MAALPSIPIPNLSLGFGDKYGPGGSQANTVNNASGNGNQVGSDFWATASATTRGLFPNGIFQPAAPDTVVSVPVGINAGGVANLTIVGAIALVLVLMFFRKGA